jgi:hypothetical protein
VLGDSGMLNTIKVALPHSLLFIMDSSGGTIPKPIGEGIVASTDSCIAVGCTPDMDGETETVLGTMAEVIPGLHLLFEGFLNTPTRRLIFQTSHNETLIEMPTPNQNTRIRVWANHEIQPDKVTIGIE